MAIVEQLHLAGWSIGDVPLRGEGDGGDQNNSMARVIVRPWGRKTHKVRDPWRDGQTNPAHELAVFAGNPGDSWICGQRHRLLRCVFRGGSRRADTPFEDALDWMRRRWGLCGPGIRIRFQRELSGNLMHEAEVLTLKAVDSALALANSSIAVRIGFLWGVSRNKSLGGRAMNLLGESGMRQTTQNTMQAAAIDRFGGIETITLRTLPLPEVGPDEVLIRVESAGVGVWDPFEREGGFAQMFGGRAQVPVRARHRRGGHGRRSRRAGQPLQGRRPGVRRRPHEP